MIELKRVLFTTDFSEFSLAAIDYACTLADRFDAELHVLHVFQEPVPVAPVPGMPFPPLGSYLEDVKRAAAEQLAKAVDAEWDENHRVVRATAQGSPFVEIIRYARENKIDMIVMGTHGRSGLSHALIGSVAERVVRKAPCPVLTIRSPKFKFVPP